MTFEEEVLSKIEGQRQRVYDLLVITNKNGPDQLTILDVTFSNMKRAYECMISTPKPKGFNHAIYNTVAYKIKKHGAYADISNGHYWEIRQRYVY